MPVTISGSKYIDADGNGVRATTLIKGKSPDIVIVLDVSGSTQDKFVGKTNVGDTNSDGLSNTILDAEISAVTSLTTYLLKGGFDASRIALVAFESNAYDKYNGTVSQVDASGKPAIVTSASKLISNGGTNYDAALSNALNIISSWNSSQPNIIFLSDGQPNSGNGVNLASQLKSRGANVQSFGVGQGSYKYYLDQIDSDGTSYIFNTPEELTAALSGKLSGAVQGSITYTEIGQAGVNIYLDLNNNGKFDSNEPTTTTKADGTYSLTATLGKGSYQLREEVPSGYSQTEAPEIITIVNGSEKFDDMDFGNKLSPTYTISANPEPASEGLSLNITLSTTGVAPGTNLYWDLSGKNINKSDIDVLSGSGPISSTGLLQISPFIIADNKTEGDEILLIKFFQDSAKTQQVGATKQITILDSSRSLSNSGSASFELSGIGQLNQILSINKLSDDPEGNGTFNYKWQSSTDNINWSNLASILSTYTVSQTDIPKYIRAQISYTDKIGFSENITTNTIQTTSANSSKKSASDYEYLQLPKSTVPAYVPAGNWNIDKYAYYVDQYPLTLKNAYSADYLAGRSTNQALWGLNHFTKWGNAEGRSIPLALLDPSTVPDTNDYGAYVENYGTTLLDIYRIDPRAIINGGTMSLFAWGKEHYTNWGKAEGREIDGGVDWGAIVRKNLDLYNKWQDAKFKTPTLSAFAYGYGNQNSIKSTNNVVVGSDNQDKLTGEIVYGLNANDVICSSGGSGILSGGFGDDLIVAANGGSDTVYGGPGSDVFQLNTGSFLNIRDFRKGADMIQLGVGLAQGSIKMEWNGAENTTYVYNGLTNGSLIAKIFGKTPTDFSFANSSNGVTNVYM
jgi:hypothetical protein